MSIDLSEDLDLTPDEVEFNTDMAAMARDARWLWIHALHGHPKPAIPDQDLLCDFIPGCEIELFLAVDMAAFETDRRRHREVAGGVMDSRNRACYDPPNCCRAANQGAVMTFRKKPVEVQAMQWSGAAEDAHPIIQWINTESDLTAVWREDQPFIDKPPSDGGQPHRPEGIFIKTLEGEMHVSPGDYVIRGVQGEFYPCKPDIFAATYDEVPA